MAELLSFRIPRKYEDLYYWVIENAQSDERFVECFHVKDNERTFRPSHMFFKLLELYREARAKELLKGGELNDDQEDIPSQD